MNLNPRTRCPYTLEPLDKLQKVNAEHVIHNSLGCPRSYCVDADEATNSEFGRTVDANFLTGLTLAMLRTQHGIESYSGVAKTKLTGTTVHGGHPVDVTIPHDRPVEVHFRKPFIPSPDGLGGTLIAGSDWEKKSEELKKNFARKGKKLEVISVESLPTTEIHTTGSINLTHLKVGLLKTAYLAAFEYLGDPFLDDPLNKEWQRGIRANDSSELESVRIRGAIHDDNRVLDLIMPDLQSHQHAVVIMRTEQLGQPVVAVRLFGSPHLSILAMLSDTNDYGMKPMQGKLVVCDSRSKSIAVSSWEDHMLRRCGIDPATTQF
jgi:hypothetical protein